MKLIFNKKTKTKQKRHEQIALENLPSAKRNHRRQILLAYKQASGPSISLICAALAVYYIKSNKEVDKKALELLGKMPKLKVLDEVDGVRCYGINNVNLSLAMNIIKSSVSNLIKSEKFVFVSSLPINVSLFKKALKK